MSYINLLTRIKNAQAVKKERLKVPYTKNDWRIAEILAEHGFIKSAEKKGRLPKRVIDIFLLYENGKGRINGVKFLSKPSRHLYAGYTDLKPVKNGYGLGLISTSRGIMSFEEARKRKLGGELLFEIW